LSLARVLGCLAFVLHSAADSRHAADDKCPMINARCKIDDKWILFTERQRANS
jgi:hypothetical protein